MKKILFLLLPVFSSILYAQSTNESPGLKGDYFGQTPPGDTPVVFARGIISDNYQQHGAPSFSPDGNIVFWQTNQRPANENEKWLTFSMTIPGHPLSRPMRAT